MGAATAMSPANSRASRTLALREQTHSPAPAGPTSLWQRLTPAAHCSGSSKPAALCLNPANPFAVDRAGNSYITGLRLCLHTDSFYSAKALVLARSLLDDLFGGSFDGSAALDAPARKRPCGPPPATARPSARPRRPPSTAPASTTPSWPSMTPTAPCSGPPEPGQRLKSAPTSFGSLGAQG